MDSAIIIIIINCGGSSDEHSVKGVETFWRSYVTDLQISNLTNHAGVFNL